MTETLYWINIIAALYTVYVFFMCVFVSGNGKSKTWAGRDHSQWENKNWGLCTCKCMSNVIHSYVSYSKYNCCEINSQLIYQSDVSQSVQLLFSIWIQNCVQKISRTIIGLIF